MLTKRRFVSQPELLFQVMDLSATKKLSKMDIFRVLTACKVGKERAEMKEAADKLDPNVDVTKVFEFFAPEDVQKDSVEALKCQEDQKISLGEFRIALKASPALGSILDRYVGCKGFSKFAIRDEKVAARSSFMTTSLFDHEKDLAAAKYRKKVKLKSGIAMSVKMMDADGDGYVDRDEFIAAGGTAEDFALLDADGDGQVTQEEFDANAALPDEKETVDGSANACKGNGWSMTTIIEESVQHVIRTKSDLAEQLASEEEVINATANTKQGFFSQNKTDSNADLGDGWTSDPSIARMI